jgi:putative hydrolase of the HAD superfamily
VTIRAVLFDLDNTLVLEDEVVRDSVRRTCDSAAAYGVVPEALFAVTPRIASETWKKSGVFEWCERFGIWWGEGLWGEFNGDSAEIAVLRAFAPSFRHTVWREALASLGVFDDRLAERLADEFRSIRRSVEPEDPDARAVLADLARDHALGLVTNGASDVQREKLSRTALATRFGAIAISVEVGAAKPDPRIFQTALEALEVSADDAAMVGDSRPRDVAGARATGLRSVWLDRGDAFSEGPGPEHDARIERLSQLRPILAGW